MRAQMAIIDFEHTVCKQSAIRLRNASSAEPLVRGQESEHCGKHTLLCMPCAISRHRCSGHAASRSPDCSRSLLSTQSLSQTSTLQLRGLLCSGELDAGFLLAVGSVRATVVIRFMLVTSLPGTSSGHPRVFHVEQLRLWNRLQLQEFRHVTALGLESEAVAQCARKPTRVAEDQLVIIDKFLSHLPSHTLVIGKLSGLAQADAWRNRWIMMIRTVPVQSIAVDLNVTETFSTRRAPNAGRLPGDRSLGGPTIGTMLQRLWRAAPRCKVRVSKDESPTITKPRSRHVHSRIGVKAHVSSSKPKERIQRCESPKAHGLPTRSPLHR